MKFVITGIVESKTEADEINKVAKVAQVGLRFGSLIRDV